MSTYKTTNLEEATYLTLNRCLPEIESITPTCSIFTFAETESLKKHRAAFWSNTTLSVNLNKWLMVRQAIKNQVKALITVKSRPADSSLIGSQYWFILDGKPMPAIYGKDSTMPENLRAAGNFFRTKEEAEHYLKVKP